MRHAIAMFGFCLLLPQAAFACMPMEGPSGTEGLAVLMSFFLGLIMLFSSMMYRVQMARLGRQSPVYAAVRGRSRRAFLIGVACIALAVTAALMMSGAIIGAALLAVFLYKIVLPSLARLVMRVNALHSIKIAGEKRSSTRRLAAAGDVQ